MTDKNTYWFPARIYGWGWGLPISWQGWLVYALAAASLIGAVFVFPPSVRPGLFQASVWSVISLLIVICWLKGEPTRWRWGK